MKNNLLNSFGKLKVLLVITLFLSVSNLLAQDSKSLICNAIDGQTAKSRDLTVKKRGVIKPDEADFRLDYDDIYEEDTQAKFLQEKGFHGGGPSWMGIIYGAFSLCGNDLIKNTDSDVSVSGVSFWSSSKEDLEKISRVIQVIKSNEKLLLESIEIAKQKEMML